MTLSLATLIPAVVVQLAATGALADDHSPSPTDPCMEHLQSWKDNFCTIFEMPILECNGVDLYMAGKICPNEVKNGCRIITAGTMSCQAYCEGHGLDTAGSFYYNDQEQDPCNAEASAPNDIDGNGKPLVCDCSGFSSGESTVALQAQQAKPKCAGDVNGMIQCLTETLAGSNYTRYYEEVRGAYKLLEMLAPGGNTNKKCGKVPPDVARRFAAAACPHSFDDQE